MPIRDRGKLKWLPAHFMPEHRSLLRGLSRDENRVPDPIIDEHTFEEFDRRIFYAMEYRLLCSFVTWRDGFTFESKGVVHFFDSIKKEIRLKDEGGKVERLFLEEIIDVQVLE